MLKINVGLSRKLTQDFNSRGFSIDIDGELPSEVLTDERLLRSTTDRLFQLANLMLDEQIERATTRQEEQLQKPTNGRDHSHAPDGNGRTQRGVSDNRPQPSNRNGSGQCRDDQPNNANSNGDRLLTQAQNRAIQNMTRKLGQNADLFARDEFGVNCVAELTVKEASQVIDLLKESLDNKAVSR
jgi:hypothetical protein